MTSLRTLYPPTEPYLTGMLDVGDGHSIYYERVGTRGGKPGHEATPIWPHDIGYTVHIDSPASRAEIVALFEAVERSCPILNLLRNPQSIRAEVRHTDSSAPERLAA